VNLGTGRFNYGQNQNTFTLFVTFTAPETITSPVGGAVTQTVSISGNINQNGNGVVDFKFNETPILFSFSNPSSLIVLL
jgi:hypothetical protein